MNKELILRIKDAKNDYDVAKDRGTGIDKPKRKLENMLFTYAGELLDVADEADALMEQYNILVQENARLQGELKEKAEKPASKSSKKE